ncbi:hypothetical protein PAXRUDRAFT_161343 [Paxillus rubicundulus Ve08.2h10]|uniref:Uncharacterized protein n=1 Tax=Paxillus rubicundulus Ve08.2h10 TaxID=930991 RepID=A0A0D0D6Z0_9AGAM|nr:hypothetical protein PAXRUDRAFT_161343 [Paxillus rubicundulus Ve08.2h10]
MLYAFTCKYANPDHSIKTRLRQKTGDGTSDLKDTAEKCDHCRGALSSWPKDSKNVLPYSKAAHCAIIALCCAKNQCPFNMVNDKYYKMEVQMLCPGTELPHTSTVSQDIKDLYTNLALDIQAYFAVSGIFNTRYT